MLSEHVFADAPAANSIGTDAASPPRTVRPQADDNPDGPARL